MKTAQHIRYLMNTLLDGIYVSEGFVRDLQNQILILEQLQQSLIQQLENSNRNLNDCHSQLKAVKEAYENEKKK